MKKIWTHYRLMIIALLLEIVLTLKFYWAAPATFQWTNHLFFWGLVLLLFAFVFKWGFENRSGLSNMSSNANASYTYHVSNLISQMTDNAFKRFEDPSSGNQFMVLAFINLLFYFIGVYVFLS